MISRSFAAWWIAPMAGLVVALGLQSTNLLEWLMVAVLPLDIARQMYPWVDGSGAMRVTVSVSLGVVLGIVLSSGFGQIRNRLALAILSFIVVGAGLGVCYLVGLWVPLLGTDYNMIWVLTVCGIGVELHRKYRARKLIRY